MDTNYSKYFSLPLYSDPGLDFKADLFVYPHLVPENFVDLLLAFNPFCLFDIYSI